MRALEGSSSKCSAWPWFARDRDDHAAYIEHWLKVLRDDKRAIFSAAAHAERACNFLHELQAERREAAA
ncbi:MAG: hypothetical protein J0L81_02070 [Caulobacterales bacterium]|nr:hypothetical protein [Caulobacterales bacterium]